MASKSKPQAPQNFSGMKTYSLKITSNDQIVTLPEKIERVTDIYLASIQAFKSQRTIEHDMNDTMYISEGEYIDASSTRTVGTTSLYNNQILYKTTEGVEHIITFPPTLNEVTDTSSYPTITFLYPHGLGTYPNIRELLFAGGAVATGKVTYTVVDDTSITLTSTVGFSSSVTAYLHCPKLHYVILHLHNYYR